jgi:hypothetical protein
MGAKESTHELPDGRRLRARFDGEADEWVVSLVGDEPRTVSARVISDALQELLEPGEPILYGSNNWFWDSADALAGRDTPLGRRFACPCCGHLTLGRAPGGTYELCDECDWEEDGIQLREPDQPGGANKVSLDEARENFRRYGICEPTLRDRLRAREARERP